MALTDNAYPNNLRDYRDAAALSRARLAALCAELADQNHVRYTAVGESTINHLERGKSQPRASTALTLATVLGKTVAELFPGGIDTKSGIRSAGQMTFAVPGTSSGRRARGFVIPGFTVISGVEDRFNLE